MVKRHLQSQFSTRQYMLSKDFEIYYYKDYHLSQVETHTHNYYEFYFFLEGNIVMEIEGRHYPLHSGDIMLIPPKVRHRAIIKSKDVPYRRFIFWISRDYCDSLLQTSSAYGYLMQYVQINKKYIFPTDRITFNTIQSRVFKLIEEMHGNRFGKEAKVSLCVTDLLLHVNRIVYEQNNPHSEREELRLYENLIDYIESHLDEALTLDDLAERFYVSKYHIAHVFKDNIGISIHQYIMRKRVAACKEAILSGAKISEVYRLYGFSDYSSFFRAFKKEYGMSPKECREVESMLVSGDKEETRRGR